MQSRLQNYKYRALFQYSYLLLLAAFIGYRAFFNTMLQNAMGIKSSNRLLNIWLILAILYIVIKEYCLRCYTAKDMLIAFILSAICIVSYYHCWTKWLEIFPFLVIAAKDVPFEKIAKTFLMVISGMLIAGYLSSRLGFSTYLVYQRILADGSVELRRAFGTTYPTTFSEFIFFLSAAALYIRRRKATFIGASIFVLIGVLLNRYCDAKTDAVCLILLAILTLVLTLQRLLPDGFAVITHKLSVLFIPIFPLFALVMIVLTVLYTPSSTVMERANRYLSTRLEIGKKGYDLYGLSLFGTKVKYHMTGGDASRIQDENYLNFDCSYMMVLINFGLLVFVVLMGLLVFSSYRAWKVNDLALLGIFAVIAVECIMENRLMQPQYNIFCLTFFATLKTDTGQEYEVINGMK